MDIEGLTYVFAPKISGRRLTVRTAKGCYRGYADLDLGLHRGINFLVLNQLTVDNQFRGRGIGRQILLKVNKYILQKRRLGLLVNAIDETSPAREMYKRHDWETFGRFSERDILTFNRRQLKREQILQVVYDVFFLGQEIPEG